MIEQKLSEYFKGSYWWPMCLYEMNSANKSKTQKAAYHSFLCILSLQIISDLMSTIVGLLSFIWPKCMNKSKLDASKINSYY